MDREFRIVLIKVLDRVKESVNLQSVLSKNSKIIKTRFGFHELSDSKCSRNGLIILEISGTDEEYSLLIEELNEIRGIIVNSMYFD